MIISETTLRQRISTYLEAPDCQVVESALALAAQAHREYVRKDGAPYIHHAIAVASQLAGWRAPAEVVAAGLLHDVLKEKYAAGVTLADIEKGFGDTVAGLVRATLRLGRFGGSMVTPGSDDPPPDQMAVVKTQLPWVALVLQRSPLAVVVKLADKLHNFESIDALPELRQRRFAADVMSIFVPLAERLGVRTAKRKLEDCAFQVLQPEEFEAVVERYPAAEREEATADLAAQIGLELIENAVPAQVHHKLRSYYDLHRLETAARKPIPLHLADPIVIITSDAAACYRALGVIHGMWPPKPGEFWDYIAAPKPNAYRALHTRLHIQPGEWLLVLIRDQQMDVVADYGITAAWQGIPVALLPSFPEWREPPPGKIGVLTPDGDFLTLPEAATPIDFAYAVHIGLGHQCTGALVNGRQVPLDRPLETGDVVRILTGKASVGPSPEWLSIVTTTRAKSAIRRWLKLQKPGDATEKGWSLLDDKLRQSGMILSSSRILRRLTTVAEALGYDSRDALLMAVGLNQCDADTVMAALQERQRRDDTRPLLRPTIVSLAEADMPQKLAACCRPAPPDSIVGYVTKQGVVTIHRADCYRVRQLRPLIQADWRHIEIQPQFEVQLVGVDRPGLLRDVTAVVADSGLNISRIHAEQAVDGSARILMVMEDIPRWQRDHVLDQLRRVPDVRRAEYQSPTSADNTTGFPWLRRHLQNPYTLRPVSGTAFFGRRAELRELINNLRDVRPGEAVLLWGPRRIGKTSLLLEFQQRVMNSEDYILVFMDMQRLSGRSVTMFLRDILKSIAQAITESRVKPPSLANMKRDPLGYFRGFIEQVPALQNKHLVLIMDEFQLLSNLHEERISLADVNRYFRSLIQHRSGLSIIFSGGGILDALLRQPDTSFMLEVARYQKIDCLDDTAARQLIVEPAPHVTYDEPVVEQLLALTAGHPYYLQWLCGELISRADLEQQSRIQLPHLQDLLTNWMPLQGEQFFNHLWGSASGFNQRQQYLSKLVLTAIAAASDDWLTLEQINQAVAESDSDLWYVLQDLVKMDTLLSQSDELYRLKMPLGQQWIQANYTVERVMKEAKR